MILVIIDKGVLFYSDFCRFEVEALQGFAGVSAVAIQGAVLHERILQLPAWSDNTTTALSMHQVLKLCTDHINRICEAEAVQLLFPLGEEVRASQFVCLFDLGRSCHDFFMAQKMRIASFHQPSDWQPNAMQSARALKVACCLQHPHHGIRVTP